MTRALLSVRELRVDYGGRPALRVDALDVAPRETLTLVGPNGSGKSTLLRVVGLLERPAAGSLRLRGEPVSWRSRDLLRERRRMANVLQQPLLCRMSVAQNVALGLRFRRARRRDSRRRVDAWLARFRIAHLRERPAGRLSGGEAQRASLARAFALEPEVLILDEPFAALDPPTRELLLADLQAVLQERRTTVLFATHDRTEALALADRVAVLSGGRLAQVGAPFDVFSRPVSAEVAAFVGVENRLSGRVVERERDVVRVDVPGGALRVRSELPVGASVLVCARPEDVSLEPADAALAGEPGALVGRVARVRPLDALVRVEIDCGVPVVALVARAAYRDGKLAPGAAVRAVFSPTATHLVER